MRRYDQDGNGIITLDELMTTVPIPRTNLLDFVRTKDEQRAACLGLPITTLFFGWFVLLLLLHDVTEDAFAVEAGVTQDLLSRESQEFGKNFFAVNSVDQLWDWLATVLVPVAFEQHVQGTIATATTTSGTSDDGAGTAGTAGTTTPGMDLTDGMDGMDGMLDPREWGFVHTYNALVGAGVSLEQTRSGETGCTISPLNDAINATCHPMFQPGPGE
jgi:hypothetical protein